MRFWGFSTNSLGIMYDKLERISLILKPYAIWFFLAPTVLGFVTLAMSLIEPEGFLWDMLLYITYLTIWWGLSLLLFSVGFADKTEFFLFKFLFSDKTDETVKLIDKLRSYINKRIKILGFIFGFFWFVFAPFGLFYEVFVR